MDRLLISVNDADIYEKDHRLFKSGNWLNDNCINYCIKQLIVTVGMKADVLIVEPAAVSFMRIQCESEEDYADLESGWDTKSKAWLLLPITNSDSFDTPSTHWSLLILHRESGKSFHFDSSSPYNRSAAISTINKLSELFQRFAVIYVIYI